MGGVPEVARVRRETLAARMTCPLCQGLLREATAIIECLHAFCRECIMKEINDEDADRCPVCNIDLGCDPEEKLRPDHNLQDIRNKLFPIKRVSPNPPAATLPAKRKQRSLASLVIDTSNVEKKAGLTGKRTKATRRRTPPHATSPDKNETVKLPSKSESQDRKTEKQSAPQSPKVATTANKKQVNTGINAPKKPLSEARKNGKTSDKEEIQKLSKTKAPRSSKVRAVMEESIINKEGELLIRKEDTANEASSSGTRVKKSRLEEGKKGSSLEPASSKEKPRTEDNLKQESLGSASTNSLHGAVTTPVWLSLVASSNQKEDTKLPQLLKNYLRIKDRCLQVSSVQKYIMIKLDLANEDEVEITCHGVPICSSSTLQGLIDFCVRREPGEPIQASFGAPAKEFVMVLGYRRRQRAPAPSNTLAVPPAPILRGQLHRPQLTETAPAALLHPPQST